MKKTVSLLLCVLLAAIPAVSLAAQVINIAVNIPFADNNQYYFDYNNSPDVGQAVIWCDNGESLSGVEFNEMISESIDWPEEDEYEEIDESGDEDIDYGEIFLYPEESETKLGEAAGLVVIYKDTQLHHTRLKIFETDGDYTFSGGGSGERVSGYYYGAPSTTYGTRYYYAVLYDEHMKPVAKSNIASVTVKKPEVKPVVSEPEIVPAPEEPEEPEIVPVIEEPETEPVPEEPEEPEIVPVPEEPEEPDTIPFSDVPESAYYYDAVVWSYNAEPQITDGVGADRFAPGSTCSRAQVVTFLWRAMGEPEPKTKANPFTDVSKDDWFYKAVLWGAENGIVQGTSTTTFGPSGTCRNNAILTFIWRALGRPMSTGVDEDGADWYKDALNWAEATGILNGTFSGKYDVNSECPRSNVVMYLYRYYNSL